jgi:hypothetical protein
MSGDPEGPVSGRRALLGLILLIALICGVLFIMHQLHESARLQDCIASGRTNCAPIEAPR